MRVCEVLSNTCFLAWGRRWINISYQTNWFWYIIGRQFDTKLCDIFCVVHGIIISLANVVILSCFRGSWKTGPESDKDSCVLECVKWQKVFILLQKPIAFAPRVTLNPKKLILKVINHLRLGLVVLLLRNPLWSKLSRNYHHKRGWTNHIGMLN